MAMSYVAASTAGANTGSTSLAISKPTGTTTGDILLAVVASNDTAWSPPDANWTQLQMLSSTAAGGTGKLFRSYLFYKVVPSTDSGVTSYTFSHPDNQAALFGHIVAIRGCDTGSPIMDSASIRTGANTSNQNTNPSISVNRTNAPSRALYWRVVRTEGSVTPGTFSESAGGWDLTIQGTAGSGAVRYGGVAAYTGDFGSLGSTAPPSGGVLVPTDVTDGHHFMVQLFGAPEGSVAADLPKVEANGDGYHRIDAGVDTQLPKAVAAFTGTATPPSGSVATDLPKLSASLEGGVPTTGSMAVTLPLVVQIDGETRQFGDHVILVEKDHRAFRVVDDGTDIGLKAIKRSQVTQQ